MKYKKINFEERRSKKKGQVDQDLSIALHTRIKIHLAVEYE